MAAATKAPATTLVVPDALTIQGEHYTRTSLIPNMAPADSPIRIVILQRGWVMIGRWTRDGDLCALDDASVIEYWGTTNGIGELVNGPTTKTRLKKCGHVEFHILAVIASISANAKKWTSL